MNTSETKYGFCPKCGAKGIARERRMDGNDKCVNGHLYKSSAATQEALKVELSR